MACSLCYGLAGERVKASYPAYCYGTLSQTLTSSPINIIRAS